DRRGSNSRKCPYILFVQTFLKLRWLRQNPGRSRSSCNNAPSLFQKTSQSAAFVSGCSLYRLCKYQDFIFSFIFWKFSRCLFPTLNVIAGFLQEQISRFSSAPGRRITRRNNDTATRLRRCKYRRCYCQNNKQDAGNNQEFAVAAVEGFRHPIFSKSFCIP